MNSEIQKDCFKTADKIISILDELDYVTAKVPSYPNLLRDLIAIEVKRNITNVTTLFYNNVAANPIVEVETETTTYDQGGRCSTETEPEGGCCGGESEDCGCK